MSGETILVVDDSPTICKLVELSLTKAGFRVETARTGEAGIEAAQARTPDLILLDFLLPDLKGDDVCRAISANMRLENVPVIVMSAKGEDIGECFAVMPNVMNIISKPFSPEALLAVVSHTLDMFVDSPLLICGEVVVEAALHLLSKAPTLAEVRKIYSHPHGLAESRKWLERNVAQVPVVETSSTGAAAEIAASEPGAAAISSELAASLYDLTVLHRRIEDHPNNLTRFLVVGKKSAPPTAEDKTSILFSIRDRVGALHRMLLPFAERRINLTKIESRPSKKKVWEYVFYVDFEGHASEPRVQEALARLQEDCIFLKILGSYPKAAQLAES